MAKRSHTIEDVELGVVSQKRSGSGPQHQQQLAVFMERTTEQLAALQTATARIEHTTERTLAATERIDAQLSVQRRLLVELLRNPRSDMTVWVVRLLLFALFVVLLARWLLV